jgi:phosphomannomutase
VRDKDGMSAALAFMDMAATLREEGVTVAERLEDLYRRAGLWVSTQLSLVRPGSEGLAEIDAAIDRLGKRYPQELAGRAVVSGMDFRADAGERPRWLASTPLVALELEEGGRVLVRPSGTEPKLKIYVDLPGESGSDAYVAERALTSGAEEIAAATARFIGL